jgi:thiosulfate/3-mercaptopyruvate sulfurtransferase
MSESKTESTFQNQQLLVSTDWLLAHLDDPAVRVVEVTPPGSGYLLGHIRGSVFLNLADMFYAGGPAFTHIAGPAAALAAKLGALGLSPDKHVILVDELGGARAAQAFWLLEYLGFPRVSVLEGGVERWMAEGRPQTRLRPAVTAVTFEPVVHAERAASREWLAERLNDAGVTLLDCRTADEYKEGHIPGAQNRDWEKTLALKAYRGFRPPAELRAEFDVLGASAAKEIVTYCASGQRSSHTYLVLRLLGYERIRNYNGSWTEWSAYPELPRE